MKKNICILFLFIFFIPIFSAGIFDNVNSGEFKTFMYQDGPLNRQLNAEYAGYLLKCFEIQGRGKDKELVCFSKFMSWDSHKYTEWEELSREPAPYATNEELAELMTYIDRIIFSRIDGYTYVLERAKNTDGEMWWWENGSAYFFQDVYIVRSGL